jgi:transcriptional regulator with XRE-family HTH domain
VPSARDPEAIYRVFGRKLRDLREAKGIPQAELATLSGLTRSSIANIENGKQRILLHQLFKFAEALGVPIDVLIPVAEVGSLKMTDTEAQNLKSAYLEKLRSLASTRPEKEHASHEEEP